MNNKRKIIFFLFAIIISLSVSAQKSTVNKIYAYGFSASFKDSVVYMTEIQEIDSAWITTKSKFLASRDNYSYQLKEYFAQQGDKNRTCMIIFALEKKDIEKKYLKMRRKYIKSGNYDIRYLTQADFVFHPVEPLEMVEEETTPPTKDKKKKNKKKGKGK